jgi:hypothetical protein
MPRCVRWERPKEGYIKLNWDAAINKLTRRMGEGIVARDDNGLVVASMSASRLLISDPLLLRLLRLGCWLI